MNGVSKEVYLNFAHFVAKKSLDKTVKILVQVHRNSSGPKHAKLLESILESLFKNEVKYKILKPFPCIYEVSQYLFPQRNIEVSFCYGNDMIYLANVQKYKESHIILCFSLVAGFNPDWPSGSLLIPETFIPFSLQDRAINKKNSYFVTNDLKNALNRILKGQNQDTLDLINEEFISLNPLKKEQMAKKLTSDDFKSAFILQNDGIFNPSQLPANFLLEE